ncbi:uncharacterized protein LOC117120452, partial [Anneissia japonica]|uniref:uncharacterized protein LOC117120452 n=1 Tax=Anneissia japonica TaxID=1529436 RepID=UPI0014258085
MQFAGFRIPEKLKKRKITAEFLSEEELRSHGKALFNLLQAAYFQKEIWKDVNDAVVALSNSLMKYSAYLESQSKRMKQNHHSLMMNQDKENFKIIEKSTNWPDDIYSSVYEVLDSKDVCEPIFLDEYAPTDRRRRYEYITSLNLPFRTLLFTHSGGAIHSHFLWKIEDCSPVEDMINMAHNIAKAIVEDLPKYHSRAMKKEFVQKFGLVANKTVLRQAYRTLT